MLSAKREKTWKIVLLGAPGVGKGTQASLLSERLYACHLSTGDVFRAAGSQPTNGSPVMQMAMDYIRRGALVPDYVVWDMVRERSRCLNCPGGFILDGFPRTLGQAQTLQQFLQKQQIRLNAVVNYDLPLAAIVARLSGRRICRNCGAIFHADAYAASVCDHCGGELYQREDDRPESITVRMNAYETSTAPLIEFYRASGLLISVDASGPPDEILARTMTVLKVG